MISAIVTANKDEGFYYNSQMISVHDKVQMNNI